MDFRISERCLASLSREVKVVRNKLALDAICRETHKLPITASSVKAWGDALGVGHLEGTAAAFMRSLTKPSASHLTRISGGRFYEA